MFFINRRNSSAYDPQTNPNGSHEPDMAVVRPDLLTAKNVVDSDILDVRRRIIVPSIQKLMTTYFDDLMNNSLKTNFFRSSAGGDRYGVELLQTDRISGSSTDGGTPIPGINLAQTVAGDLSSEVVRFNQNDVSVDVPATTVLPIQQALSAPSGGIFSLQVSRFKTTYIAPGSPYDGKPVPGVFYGQGTNVLTFVFDKAAITKTIEPLLTFYHIAAEGIEPSTTALTYVPSDPKLVKNYTSSGDAFFYQGVMDTEDSKVSESWASPDVAGFTNYALAYKTDLNAGVDQQHRASSVEVHFFQKVAVTGNTYPVQSNIGPVGSSVTYSLYTIKKINNITAGFSHKILDINVTGSPIIVTAEAGYEFVTGTIIEIVAMALATSGNTNIRNGATVNFNPSLKKIYNFAESVTQSITPVSNPFSITVSNGLILGCSTTETSASLNQPVCFVGTHTHQISVTGFGTNTITINDPSWVLGNTITIQLLVNQNVLPFPDDASVPPDGLLISYNYVPPQCQMNLPATLTVSPAVVPSVMYISNLGSGGGITGEPYLTPLQHIPIGDPTIVAGDNIFSNIDFMQFSNFSIDSGFAQVPVSIPGSFADSIVLSSATLDAAVRSFYSIAFKEFIFSGEGLQFSTPRKVFLPIIARVNDPTNKIYMHGEYVLVIFSRGIITETENRTGYFSNGNCSISIYRLPNRPISRVS
jgi:hypothetical protein